MTIKDEVHLGVRIGQGYPRRRVIDIMWPTSQSQFCLSFIFIVTKFYSMSFLCDVCNEVYGHI